MMEMPKSMMLQKTTKLLYGVMVVAERMMSSWGKDWCIQPKLKAFFGGEIWFKRVLPHEKLHFATGKDDEQGLEGLMHPGSLLLPVVPNTHSISPRTSHRVNCSTPSPCQTCKVSNFVHGANLSN